MLIFQSINTFDIKVGDEIAFDYTHPHKHPPQRIGMVEGFVGNKENKNLCVMLYDYSLYDGARVQSYRLDRMRLLGRIEDMEEHKPRQGWYDALMENLISFTKRFSK